MGAALLTYGVTGPRSLGKRKSCARMGAALAASLYPTRNRQLSVWPSTVAVSVTRPAATPVTVPSEETVATDASETDQLTAESVPSTSMGADSPTLMEISSAEP